MVSLYLNLNEQMNKTTYNHTSVQTKCKTQFYTSQCGTNVRPYYEYTYIWNSCMISLDKNQRRNLLKQYNGVYQVSHGIADTFQDCEALNYDTPKL